MSSGSGVHFGCADVGACFHRLRLRGHICEHFFWEPFEAEWLGEVLSKVCVFFPAHAVAEFNGEG